MKQNVCHHTPIVGASFTVSAMSNHFVDIIMNALNTVDSSKVWMETDDVTTTIRGKSMHIFDVTRAIFLHAAATGEHIAFQATYSVGCPGDSEADVYLAEDDHPVNKSKVEALKQDIAAKFSLYPLGDGDYMKTIYEQIEAMKEEITVSAAHYSTRLRGDAQLIFKNLERAFNETVDAGSSHTVMTVSISANSPSHK
ncbi:MAG TPA: YkoF family thiamine/hydroxymethylpyrimidine-binding protein [Virgibacillus sp.]|nr:YkoF family thiamine/hydroxymethylpyrimidine-binding protein [Virgibacillus sp.]